MLWFGMSFVCPANVSKLNRSIVSGGIAFFSTYWEEKMHISISLCIAFPSPLDNNFPLSLSIRYSQFNFRPCKVLIYNLQMPVNDLVLLLSLLPLLLLFDEQSLWKEKAKRDWAHECPLWASSLTLSQISTLLVNVSQQCGRIRVKWSLQWSLNLIQHSIQIHFPQQRNCFSSGFGI